MSKFTVAGLFSFLGGLLLLGFQAIASLMKMEGGWQSLSLLDVFDEAQFYWIDNLSWNLIQQTADYVIAMPLFALFFVVGLSFFMVSAFLGR